SEKIKQLDDGQCWRMCGNMSAGHFHIFWECPIISLYWIEVVKVIRSIFGSELEFNFSVTTANPFLHFTSAPLKTCTNKINAI
uniref:Reverse transcriptase zinc-binding domain-containing protein n=1 Tax=Cyprinus carpio carpio TaxID=630221 RepID=A0A9J8C7C8_CYPCA